MSALHGVWIASIVGALLFWLAGYLMARGRGSRAESAATDYQQRLAAQEQQVAAITAERDRFQQESTVLGGQMDAVKDERDNLEQQNLDQHNRMAAIESDRDAMRQDRDALQMELDALRQESAGYGSRVSATEDERDRLKQDLLQHKKVLQAAKEERAQLKTNLAHLQARLNQADNELGQAAAEITTLREELSDFANRSDTREVQEVTETGTNVRAALLQSEEKARNLAELLQVSEHHQARYAARLKKTENSLAEAHQELGGLQVDLMRAKEKLQAALGEVKLKTARISKLEGELSQGGGGDDTLGELDTTPGGTGMPLTKKTLSLLLERTRDLTDELKQTQSENKKLENEAKRRIKLEQLLTAMKARLESTEEKVVELGQERDRLLAQTRQRSDKQTIPGGFDGP